MKKQMVTPALFHKVRHKWDLQEWKTISLLFILTSNRFVILTSLSLLSALISFSFSFFCHTVRHAGSKFCYQELYTGPLQWKCGTLTTGLPGKSLNCILMRSVSNANTNNYNPHYKS